MNTLERGIVAFTLLFGAGGAKIDVAAQQSGPQFGGHGAPWTESEIQQSLDLDYLHSPECASGPASQACVDVMNACNGNAQKPPDEQTKGCFSGYVYDSNGVPRDTLTGFVNVGIKAIDGTTITIPLYDAAQAPTTTATPAK